MKKLFRKRSSKEQTPSRITNETVAEHRERILAGGRRFKYPMQYARHRLVFNTVLISVVALVAIGLIGWWQLYPAQNTSDFFYRITSVLPLPVARVDGEPVRYSDYLMNYNSSIHYLQQKEQTQLSNADGKRTLDFYKSRSLLLAVGDAYAQKVARERKLTVSDDEVTKYIDNQRKARDGTVSEETYNAVILDYYGWSPAEYRHVMKNKLIRQKVAYEIDNAAKQKMEQVATAVAQNSADFDAIVKTVNTGGVAVQSGVSGLVPTNNQDGGLSDTAGQLAVGQVSSVIKSTTGDGYYFVKLLEKNSTQINYAFIKVPLTAFSDSLKKLYTDHKVIKYIKVDDVDLSGFDL